MKTKTLKTFKKYMFIWSLLIYPAILFMIFYVGVNVNSLILAFQKIDIINNTRTFIGLENFANFFLVWQNDLLFNISVTNSLKMFIINFSISIPLMIIFSYYIYKKFLFTKAYRLLVMIPSVVSIFVICLLFKKFVQTGLPDFFIKVFNIRIPELMSDPKYTFSTSLFYMIWISFSTSLLVLPNAMKEIPDEVIESAQIDGVTYLKELRYIIIPLIMPTLTTFIVVGVSAVFSTIGPIHAFYMYDAYPEVYNVGYYLLQKTMTSNTYEAYPFLAASGIVFTLIIAPITILVKFLLEKINPVEE